MNSNELIKQARELCEKATPGPWEAKTNSYPQCNGEPWGWIRGVSGHITWSGNSGQANAAFIAASRTIVPRLCDALEVATARAEKAEAENRWIPTGERLPVESEYRDKSTGELVPLLVCVKGTEYPFRAMYDGKSWGDGWSRIAVTHWMPLPEPPKGAQDE